MNQSFTQIYSQLLQSIWQLFRRKSLFMLSKLIGTSLQIDKKPMPIAEPDSLNGRRNQLRCSHVSATSKALFNYGRILTKYQDAKDLDLTPCQ